MQRLLPVDQIPWSMLSICYVRPNIGSINCSVYGLCPIKKGINTFVCVAKHWSDFEFTKQCNWRCRNGEISHSQKDFVDVQNVHGRYENWPRLLLVIVLPNTIFASRDNVNAPVVYAMLFVISIGSASVWANCDILETKRVSLLVVISYDSACASGNMRW